jgi:signal transduction histidine kinase
MSFIATQAAIAIANARFYEELRDERDHLVHLQEDTRQKLSTNLEDGPVQLLSAIRMSLDHLDQLSTSANPKVMQNQIGALRNLVSQATRGVHTMLFELHPVILKTQGLIAAAKQYVSQLNQTEQFTIHFETTAIPVNYSPQTAGAIFAITQEAINNVKRHAQANNVWLSFEIKGNRFIATIKDDGQGFDTQEIGTLLEKQAAYGFLNMRERAASISAELQIESKTQTPKQGTIIRLLVPWPPVNTTDNG